MTDTNNSASGRLFEREDLSGARFRLVDLAGARFEQANLWNVVMRGVDLVDVDISGDVKNVIVNGVDIAPLVLAELDRRDPERVAMRPTDAAGFRAAWEIVERRWGETVDRARALDPVLLHERVDHEWSFIETLRHLLFATDAWVRRGLLGDPAPWHPLDLPWDTLEPLPETPCDRDARPSLDEVVALRRDRMGTVRQVLADLDDAALAGTTTAVDAPGWPPPESFPVDEVLSTVLNEEWEHRRYAERDLAVLETRPQQAPRPKGSIS